MPWINRLTGGIGGQALHVSASHVKHHQYTELRPATVQSTRREDYVTELVGVSRFCIKRLESTATDEEARCWLKEHWAANQNPFPSPVSKTYHLHEAGQDS